jgi:hypothetical protein
MGDAVAMATFYQPCPQKSLRNDRSESTDPCAAAACIYDTHAVVSIVIVVLGLADAGLEAPVAGIIDIVAALRYPQGMGGCGRCATMPQCMPFMGATARILSGRPGLHIHSRADAPILTYNCP